MSKRSIARILLENKAVTLNVKEPYTYTSGIRSPIYCDNRLMLSNVDKRGKIILDFVKELKKLDFDIVAGTSTAGIPWSAWVSYKLKKPMSYIRSGKRNHGKGKQIEGADVSGKKIVIIEDLVSTGGSSFSAVEAARKSGAEVICVIAIFTYELDKAKRLFSEGKCELITLTDFTSLLKVANDIKYISRLELNFIKEWNKDPENWGPSHGFPNAKRV